MIKNKFFDISILTTIFLGIFLISFSLGIKDVQAATATASCNGGSPVISLSWPYMDGAINYNIRRNGSIIATNNSTTSYIDNSIVYAANYDYIIEGNTSDPMFVPTDGVIVTSPVCVYVSSFTGPTSVTVGSSATYNASFAGGNFIGTQIYLVNPAGAEFWGAGGSNSLTAVFDGSRFPIAGTYSVCADSWVNDSNPAPGSVSTDRECKNVTVTPSSYTLTGVSDGNGSITSSRTVPVGSSAALDVVPANNYVVDRVIITTGVANCPNATFDLVNTFRVPAVNGNCEATAYFVEGLPATYQVTGSAGSGGNISPSLQIITVSNSASFTVIPDSGYQISGIGDYAGTMCDVSGSGAIYTTGPITDACTVTVYFSLIPPPPSTPNLVTGTATPTSAIFDVSTSYSAVITNIGGASTGSSSFNNLFQFDHDSDHTAVNGIAVVSAGPLDSGGTANVSASYPFPTGVTTGYVRLCADNNASWVGTVDEGLDEGDNCGSPWQSVTVGAGGGGSGLPTDSDLIAGDNLIPPSNPQAGVFTTLSYYIYNSGTGSTNGSFPNLLEISTESGGGGTVTSAGITTLLTQAGNTTATADWTYTFPEAGTYYVSACADQTSSLGGGLIIEVNEVNNCSRSWSGTRNWSAIIVAPAPPASGTVDIQANPGIIATGESSTLTWSSEGSTSCKGTNFSTNTNTFGNAEVTPGRTTTYRIDCVGTDPSTDSVVVYVRKRPIFIEN